MGGIMGRRLAVDLVCHRVFVCDGCCARHTYWHGTKSLSLITPPSQPPQTTTTLALPPRITEIGRTNLQWKLRVSAKKLVVCVLVATSGLSLMLASNHFLRS